MAGSEKSKTSWWTVGLSALLAAALSFVVSYKITDHTFKLNQDAQMERAAKYADKLEARLEFELENTWEAFRIDSLRWERARADSIEFGESDLSARGLLRSSARTMLHEQVNRQIDELISDALFEIQRYEGRKRLEIETIRETGVLLK